MYNIRELPLGGRGITIAFADLKKCETYKHATFDAFSGVDYSKKLTDFIRSLPVGTVIFGTSCDESARHLEMVETELKSLGIITEKFSQTRYGDKWVFAATVGSPELVRFAHQTMSDEHTLLVDFETRGSL